jgi:hypothetical protein
MAAGEATGPGIPAALKNGRTETEAAGETAQGDVTAAEARAFRRATQNTLGGDKKPGPSRNPPRIWAQNFDPEHKTDRLCAEGPVIGAFQTVVAPAPLIATGVLGWGLGARYAIPAMERLIRAIDRPVSWSGLTPGQQTYIKTFAASGVADHAVLLADPFRPHFIWDRMKDGAGQIQTGKSRYCDYVLRKPPEQKGE